MAVRYLCAAFGLALAISLRVLAQDQSAPNPSSHQSPSRETLDARAEILETLNRWFSGYVSGSTAMSSERACQMLLAKGVSQAAIEMKLGRLSVNNPSVLASYVDLHGITHLDQANNAWTSQIDHRSAALLKADLNIQFIRSLLQMAEIAIVNLESLYRDTAANIRSGHFLKAAERQRWIDSFHNTLLELSKFRSRFIPGRGYDRIIGVNDSPNMVKYQQALSDYHSVMMGAGWVSQSHIGSADLSDPRRRLTFMAFNNEAIQVQWLEGLSQILIPEMNLQPPPSSPADFYRQFVGAENIQLAVHEVRQLGDNYLTQFRAYHQISEVFVRFMNLRLNGIIRALLDENSNLVEVDSELRLLSHTLSIVESGVQPILRNIAPVEYQIIRGSLGITSGSHSPNIRMGLFQTTFPLLTQAAVYRMCGGEFDEARCKRTLADVVDVRHQSAADQTRFGILQSVLEIHELIGRWRNLHLQFVRTQLGVSRSEAIPTASIAGSPSAIASAQAMRAKGNQRYAQFIACVFEALRGVKYHPPSVGLDLDSPFGQEMGAATADMVRESSADVQDRVRRH